MDQAQLVLSIKLLQTKIFFPFDFLLLWHSQISFLAGSFKEIGFMHWNCMIYKSICNFSLNAMEM